MVDSRTELGKWPTLSFLNGPAHWVEPLTSIWEGVFLNRVKIHDVLFVDRITAV